MFVLKVSRKDDLRRLIFEDHVEFSEVLGVVCARFELETSDVKLTYLDTDGDIVTIGSTEDLQEAVRQVTGHSSSVLWIHLKTDQDDLLDKRSSTCSSAMGNYDVLFPEDEEAVSEDSSHAVEETVVSVDSPYVIDPEPSKADYPMLMAQHETGTRAPPPTPLNDEDQEPLSEEPKLAVDVKSTYSEPTEEEEEEEEEEEDDDDDDELDPENEQHKEDLEPTRRSRFVAELEAAVMKTVQTVANAAAELAQSISSHTRSEEPVSHPGVYCDHCGMFPIIGHRFKCTICADYDLCSECEQEGVHCHDHPMLKLRYPYSDRNCLASTDSADEPSSVSTAEAVLLQHVTLVDGTPMLGGTSRCKVWAFRNVSSKPLVGATLQCVGTGCTVSPVVVQVPPTQPGCIFDLAVDITAPKQLGRFVSFWTLVDSDGRPFGPRVWADIVVVSEEAHDDTDSVVDGPSVGQEECQVEQPEQELDEDEDEDTVLVMPADIDDFEPDSYGASDDARADMAEADMAEADMADKAEDKAEADMADKADKAEADEAEADMADMAETEAEAEMAEKAADHQAEDADEDEVETDDEAETEDEGEDEVEAADEGDSDSEGDEGEQSSQVIPTPGPHATVVEPSAELLTLSVVTQVPVCDVSVGGSADAVLDSDEDSVTVTTITDDEEEEDEEDQCEDEDAVLVESGAESSLTDMGFSLSQAREALLSSNYDLSTAVAHLVAAQ